MTEEVFLIHLAADSTVGCQPGSETGQIRQEIPVRRLPSGHRYLELRRIAMAYHGSALIPFFGGEMRPLFGLRREIDRLFDDMAGSTNARWSPAVDVRETDKSLAIDVELPGIKPENVEVNVENGVLSITGEKRSERTDEEKDRYHMVERSYGSFFRSFQLPAGVDESQIKASFHDGVLTVDIPKAALPQPRKIQIAGQTDKDMTSAPSREPVIRSSHAASSSTSSADRMAASGSEQAPNESRR